MNLRWPALLTVLAVSSGCVTTTTIHSSPSGAKVYIDGVLQGETPLTLSLPDGADNGYRSIRLEKEGYLATEAAIGRKQDPVRLVCGYFCLVPMLWVYKWEPSYSVTLKDLGADSAPPAHPSAPAQAGPANVL